ncbi:MAG TPA: ABC transporter ATP-binding protein [Kiritimatiellia bacterium]|jgi:putative ABC transport system ATP-binding protein|nr:ABC transporter ATP-binding protein [Kiritimatiellia bacterium]HRT28599.1 ABC transporter ATP-binding protein [Kiritimatiellia bacterium]
MILRTTERERPRANEVVRLDDVKRYYRVGDETVRALDGVSFSINTGSYWAIMGPSGSGKSTMLNILGCLDRPTSGAYWLNGVNVAEMDDNELSDHRLRNLGFVFQSFHLIPQLTVYENIEVPMLYLGVPPNERRQKAEVLAERVGIAHRLRHLPSELSGGQRQRVAVARALANDPAVLLADEPTGNLDSATSVQIMALFQELHDQGKTIILVTHELDIAEYAKAKIVLKDGVILSSEEIRS